jgi:benzoyl-CoA reductase/2-hydroxyglutaryl-CoA dehydratase subunit BcrC/BadD/HgdB
VIAVIGAYFDSLVHGLEAKLASADEEFTARKRFTLEVARLGGRLFSSEGHVAWCGVLAPFDLLNAMGVTSCFVEFVGAILASVGNVEAFLGIAEEDGHSTDTCGYHRAVMGAAHQGLVPEPDFLIATTAPCTGGLAAIENLSRLFDKDLFVLQVPHQQSEEAVELLAGQLRDMTDFVAAHTGKPLESSKLGSVIERSNRLRELLVEVYELAKVVPSPARRRDLVNFGIVTPLFFGSDEAIEMAEVYRDEFARKVDAGIAGVPSERIRLLWLQNRIQFKHSLDELIEEQYGAAIVADELNDVTWEPIDLDDPYPGIARRMMSVALVGPAERRIKNLQRLAHEYRVQGALNPCHWGCRQGTGVRGLVAAGLRDVGVSVLNLEVDCVDPRNFAEGQLTTRLGAFLEMLSANSPGTS